MSSSTINRGRLLVAALLLWTLAGCQSGSALQEASVATAVDFAAHQYAPVVPVTINGHGPYQFMLDTGTARTAVAMHVCRDLNLKATDASRNNFVVGAAGVEIVDERHVRSMDLGGRRWTGLQVLARDLTVFNQHSGLGRIDGILGLDLFRDGVLTIDFPNRRVTYDPAAELDASDPQVIAARKYRNQVLLVPVKLGGNMQYMVLDSGSSVGIALNRGLAGQVEFEPHLFSQAMAAASGGTVALTRGFMRVPVSLGPHTLRWADAAILPAMQGTAADLSLLGSPMLAPFVLSVDFHNERVRFGRPPAPVASQQLEVRWFSGS